MFVVKKCLILLLAASVCVSLVQSEIDFSNVNVDDLKSQLPNELAKRNFTLDKAKEMVKDKCVKVAGEKAGEAAYQDIENGITEFAECITGVINITAIQSEIEEASPNGELDVVFHKYCNKKPDALVCAEKLNEKFVPCLDKDEKESQDVFMRIMKSLLDFVCHKGGDQIALFIAEKGPECLSSKKQDIQDCINSTFSSYIPKDGVEQVNSIPKLVMDKKHCEDIDKLGSCVVEKLESCEEITPANIVESMFRFIRNETICRNTKKIEAAPHAAEGKSGSTLIVLNFTSFCLILGVFGTLSKYLQNS